MRALACLALGLALGAGCGGASPASGVDALFRVARAQFVPGALGMQTAAPAPEMHTIGSNNNRLYPGVQGKGISGTVGPGGAAVKVGLAGDVGHWVMPVEDMDQSTPGDFIFSLKVSFSPALPPGPATLIFRAVTRDGQVGPPKTQMLTLDPTADDAPLRITLTWDSQADLDLRVLAPAANAGAPVEIGPKKATNLNPPGHGDPDLSDKDLMAAGRYGIDSNAQCLVIDGQRVESVTWMEAPPAGHYEVRVDTFSMCGEAVARWKLTVRRGGEVKDERLGQSTEADTRYDHRAGAGLQVTYFDL